MKSWMKTSDNLKIKVKGAQLAELWFFLMVVVG